MNLFHQSKFSSVSKNVRKIALLKGQAVEHPPSELKAASKVSGDLTPRKQMNERPSWMRSSNKFLRK